MNEQLKIQCHLWHFSFLQHTGYSSKTGTKKPLAVPRTSDEQN